jgi:hypothetical protein
MIFHAKKYIGLFVIAFLLGGVTQTKAQTPDSVIVRCVAVDAAGDVTLTWTLPSNTSLTSDGWVNYQIYVVGNITPIAIITNPAQTSYTIPYTSLSPSSANSSSISFYIETNNSHVLGDNSNIVSTIFLSVFSNAGVGYLTWNPISTPLPQGSSQWYQIYREVDSNNTWTLIDSIKSPITAYNDSLINCTGEYLNYQIRIADSTICVSTSNEMGSTVKDSEHWGPNGIIMDTLSVTPGSNSVDITWGKSTKSNVIGYVIFENLVNSSGSIVQTPIDTVYGINTDFLMNYTEGGNPSDSVLTFEVAALDTCGREGPISNPQNSMLLKVTPDRCAQKNTLSWNLYANLAGNHGKVLGVGGYTIFYSVNSGPFQYLGSTDNKTDTYIDSNLTVQELRCYYVQVYDSVNHDTTASSNRVCEEIQPPPPPKNNYLRTATVVFNTAAINIVGYVDTLSGAEYYDFERSTDTAGGYSSIYMMNAPLHTDSINYIDNSVSPTTRSYHYKVFTLDSCDKVIDSTNLGQTMLLTAVGNQNSTNTLTWNDYRNWTDNPAYYLIYRSEDGVNYTELSPSVNYTDAGQNQYIDNISGITTGQGTFYYYVKAVENFDAASSPYTDTSYSNIADAYQNPIVYVPDAFCPTGVNKIFIPVGVFIDVTGYDFSIIDRWGDLVFESNDPTIGWNGTYKGGKIVPEGVYVYLLTYTSSKGEYFQKRGTVSLLK